MSRLLHPVKSRGSVFVGAGKEGRAWPPPSVCFLAQNGREWEVMPLPLLVVLGAPFLPSAPQ